MRNLDADRLAELLDYPSLIDRLNQAFQGGCTVPLRHHHDVAVPGGNDGTLLLMPAWKEGGVMGVKIATVFPGNGAKGLESVMASYLLLDGSTGSPLALAEGRTLTARRTAAASALAASKLACKEARSLMIVGTGRLASELIAAHRAVRPIDNVAVWGRTGHKAASLAARLDTPECRVKAVTNLPCALREADIISCATLATEPLVLGNWLCPGQHLDLVGGFKPTMREADDDAVLRATLFVDTRAGACHEAGDIADPMERGVIDEADIAAELVELCRGDHPGRQSDDEITLFKSVGTALEDLAAAELAYERDQDQ